MDGAAKYIFITGGVVSSLGKGITAASLGTLLKAPRREDRRPQARSVHQRGSGHDVAVPARRGVRHRGRRRDRPRPRPLRALHRREHVARVERHHRRDLLLGDPQGAQRRVPGRHGAGHPAHHRRDQEPHPRVGSPSDVDVVHRRDRRHGRRHREPAVPRGDPPAAHPARPRQRDVRPRHAGAVHPGRRRAQDQADAALGERAAAHRYRARRGGVPLLDADVATSCARRSRCSPISTSAR